MENPNSKTLQRTDLTQNFRDLPEDVKVKLIMDQLSGIRFGELTVIVKHNKIFGYKYTGEQKFFITKIEEKKEPQNA
jgi:hypothetical protein